VLGVDALGDVGARTLVGREQQVGNRVAAAMSALEQNRARPERQQHLAGTQEIVACLKRKSTQPFRFRQVGRDELGEREEGRLEHVHDGIVREFGAAG